MDTRTVGDLKILTPDLDPEDLDPVDEAPDDDLMEASVDGASWPGLRLGGIRISRSRLAGVDLSGTAWRGGALYGCLLDRVDCSTAAFVDLTIERSVFVNCRMSGVRFEGVTLKNVIFEDCRMDYGTLERVRVAGPVAWVGCNLADGACSGSRLPNVVLSGCRLAGFELTDTDLTGADLRGSGLAGLTGVASLRGAAVDEGQLGDLLSVVVRELDLRVLDRRET